MSALALASLLRVAQVWLLVSLTTCTEAEAEAAMSPNEQDRRLLTTEQVPGPA